MLTSQICTQASLVSPELRVWSERLRPIWDPEGNDPKPVVMHRKMWEWLFACAALAERDMLRTGRSGLGFGVGREPLVALFAGLGCTIMATDLDPEQAAAAGWENTGDQHAEWTGGLDGLNDFGLCDDELFRQRTTYAYVDMRHIPDTLTGFDFTWSSCAFEHLGSLQAGLSFVRDQMQCLRPGGVAVHTTEYNVSSNDETPDGEGTVLFRRRDIEGLVDQLRADGYVISCDFTEGITPEDQHIDVPPFTDTHLRTTLGAFVTTSIALIVEKPESWAPPRPSRLRRAFAFGRR